MIDKQKIAELRNLGQTYRQIAKELNCSEWTVRYHLLPCRKIASAKYEKTLHPLKIKLKRFLVKGTVDKKISCKEVFDKFEKNPFCELTGEKIDLMNSDSYSLDHRIPLSKGGKSSLENMALLKQEVNQSKYNLSNEEFISLCKRVSSYNL